MKKLKIRTLTPLWTGTYEEKSTKLKITSIIGSLRWYFEALVRGFGLKACDPTTDPCEKKEGASEICHACEVFGCTGYRRPFILRGNDLGTTNLFFKTLQDNKWWLKKQFGDKKQALFGETTFEIIELKEKIEDIIYALFFFIQKYGALGAKTQNGFGQFQILNDISEEKIEKLLQEMYDFIKKANNQISNSDYFILKYKINKNNHGIKDIINNYKQLREEPVNFKNFYIPCGFDIRYNLKNQNKSLKKVFGSRNNASRVFVSHLYKEKKRESNYYLKVWGFIPQQFLSVIDSNLTLNKFRKRINSQIKNHIFKDSELILNKTGKEIIKGGSND